MKFNESSKNIFDNIADFIWFITRDAKNYYPKVEPYVGCSSNCKKIHPIININTKRQIENYDLEIGK